MSCDQAAAVAVDVDARAVDDREAADALHDVELGVGVVGCPRAAAAAEPPPRRLFGELR